jgi:hypothetical protein
MEIRANLLAYVDVINTLEPSKRKQHGEILDGLEANGD